MTGAELIEDDADASLTQRAHRRLQWLIVRLELKPGQVLSETGLSRMLDMGRTPIREAIKMLEREGLVTVWPRRGIVVTDINIASHMKMLEVRGELECLVGRLAAARATPAQRRRMVELADQADANAESGNVDWFMHESWEFHELPVEATENEHLAAAMKLFSGLSRRFWAAHRERYGDVAGRGASRVHADRLRAIAGGDVDEAQRASEALRDYLFDFCRSTIDGVPRYSGRARAGD